MATREPVTIEGNLTRDPEHGVSDAGNEYAHLTVAVNERYLDKATNRWADADTVFHRVVVFNQQSRNVTTSLRKGDSVIVAGELRTGTYTDKDTGITRETREIVAANIGASLKFATVAVDRAPKASGPAADRSATGPVAEPVSSTGAGVVR